MPSVTNLIQGPGKLYLAAFGATEPADIDVGTVPDVDWTDVGYTKDGVELAIEQEYSELEVDQLVDVPGRRLILRDLKVTTNLAEATLANLKLAMGGGTEDTGVGFESFEPLTPSGEPSYIALIIDGLAPNGLVRRVIIRKSLQIGSIEFAYAKDEQTVFAVEFGAHYVSSVVAPYKIVDEIAV